MQTIRAFPAFAVFFLFVLPLHAQIIEEDEVYSTAAKGEFFGRISGSASSGGSVTSSYGGLAFGYDTSFARERGRFYFSALASQSDLKVESELTDEARQRAMRNNEDLDDLLVTIDTSDSTARVDDAFVQYDVFDNFEVVLGRRRVNWGQFSLLSPVSLMLPLSISNAEAVNDKVSTLFAQDQIAFSWYPTERLELSGYHFFTTNLDPLFETVLENQQELDGFNATGGDKPQMKQTDIDLTDNTHWAARAVYYGNWGTIGFTYHEGHDTLGLDTKNAVLRCQDGVMPVSGDCMPVGGFRYYQPDTDIKLYESKSYGIELAIPRGDWVWKFEMLQQDTMSDLRAIPVKLGETSTNAADVARNMYYKAVFEDNEGKLFIPSTRTLAALGADRDGDNWRLNLTLAYFDPGYEDEELVRLQDAALGESEVSGDVIAPVLNIARYMGGNKNKETGLVAGFLATYVGASLYHTSLHREKFRWTVALEAISNLRDELTAETENDQGQGGSNYEIKNEINVGGRIAFSYSF